MPLNPNPLADLLAAVDAALARLLAPLGRDLARLVARAGAGWTVPSRLPAGPACWPSSPTRCAPCSAPARRASSTRTGGR